MTLLGIYCIGVSENDSLPHAAFTIHKNDLTSVILSLRNKVRQLQGGYKYTLNWVLEIRQKIIMYKS